MKINKLVGITLFLTITLGVIEMIVGNLMSLPEEHIFWEVVYYQIVFGLVFIAPLASIRLLRK